MNYKTNKTDSAYNKTKTFDKKKFGIKIKFSKSDRNSWKKDIKYL